MELKKLKRTLQEEKVVTSEGVEQGLMWQEHPERCGPTREESSADDKRWKDEPERDITSAGEIPSMLENGVDPAGISKEDFNVARFTHDVASNYRSLAEKLSAAYAENEALKKQVELSMLNSGPNGAKMSQIVSLVLRDMLPITKSMSRAINEVMIAEWPVIQLLRSLSTSSCGGLVLDSQ